MKTFGLTGGIGCGKSTVSSYLREFGVSIIDADILSREAVDPATTLGQSCLHKIRKIFGESVVKDGGLDRKALAKIVFNDHKARMKLNYIIHPYIERLTFKKIDELESEGVELAAYDSALLFEAREHIKFSPVMVVHVSHEEQVRRAMLRDGSSYDDVMARIAAQMPIGEKVELADVAIDNNGTPEELRDKTKSGLDSIRKLINVRT